MRVTKRLDNPPPENKDTVTPTMRRKLLGTLIALSLVAAPGLAAAQPLAIVTGDGGGHASGQADADYNVDASDGEDKAHQTHRDAQAYANSEADNKNEAYQETKWSAYENVDKTELPQRPQCECDDLAGQVEQAGDIEATHADQVEKSGQLDSEYVDADADVSAAGHVKAWTTDTFKGLTDAFDEVRELMGQDVDAHDDAKASAESALDAEDELRNEAVSNTDLDNELPDANPSANGNLNAEHATEIATDATGNGEAQVP